jgi:hypothetical protein
MKKHPLYILSLMSAASAIAATTFPDAYREPDFKTVATALAPERALPPTQVAIIPVGAELAYTPLTADIFGGMSAALETLTRDATTHLAPLQENLDRNLDAEISNWKAHGGNSSTLSEEHLALARTDFRQKVGALSLVDEETFGSAKENAISSLRNVQQAYSELLVSTVRK